MAAIREIFSGSEGQLSSTRVIAVLSSVVGWAVVLILVIGMYNGKFKDADLNIFVISIPILLGGPMGLKGHQNHRKKQEN